VDGLAVLISPIYIVDTDRRLVCHIRNVDGNQTILPKPILMWTNERQHLEDEKAENCHFRIGPLPQYAQVLVTSGNAKLPSTVTYMQSSILSLTIITVLELHGNIQPVLQVPQEKPCGRP